MVAPTDLDYTTPIFAGICLPFSSHKVCLLAFPPTSPLLARALMERDYNEPTEVQSAVLTPEAAGRDLLVSAVQARPSRLALPLVPTFLTAKTALSAPPTRLR